LDTDRAFGHEDVSLGDIIVSTKTYTTIVIPKFDIGTFALAEYPSRKAFLEIARSRQVPKIGQDRTKGLAASG
jgi:hypothetical protein